MDKYTGTLIRLPPTLQRFSIFRLPSPPHQSPYFRSEGSSYTTVKVLANKLLQNLEKYYSIVMASPARVLAVKDQEKG